MKIAILTTDSREHFKDYSNPIPYFGTAPEALLQGFASLPDIEVHVVCCVRAPVQSPAKLAPNIYYHHLYVPRIGWMSTLYQGCVRAVRKKLDEIRPDIVHGQGTERDCAITAVLSGYPNVLTIHGNMRLIARVNRVKTFSFIWLAAQLEALTLPRSRGVICITRYTREAVKDLARRTWVVPNAVDASFFDVNPAPTTDEVPRILCVGHICLRKNQNAFIRALDELAAQRKFEIIFLGQAAAGRAYDDEFFSLIGERKWCVYGGMAGREKLKEHLRGASGLALPSLEDNCPMAVLEAMAAGVPVAAADVGGVPDLIEDGKTGFLLNPLDDRSMRQAIENLLTQPAAARDMAQQAKQQAREKFHPQAIATRHIEIYREVLSSDS